MDENTQNTEQEPENQEQASTEPTQEQKMLEYYKNELEKTKSEIKELVTQRDIHKNESLELKKKHSRKNPTETDEYKELFTENKNLKEKLEEITKRQEVQQKKEIFTQVAAEKGMSEEALKSLDAFNIDFDAINPEDKISAEILVENMKKNMGFLFQSNKSAPKAPNKLIDSNQTVEEQYNRLVEQGDLLGAAELKK